MTLPSVFDCSVSIDIEDYLKKWLKIGLAHVQPNFLKLEFYGVEAEISNTEGLHRLPQYGPNNQSQGSQAQVMTDT